MQPQNSRDALSQLQSFQSSRRKPQDVIREQEQQLGLPSAQQRQIGLRAAIGNTENLLRNVDPSVSGRTQGSLVTEAQKQRLVAMEREPISDQFREQSRALEGETANLNELNRRALTGAQLAISEQDAQENALRGVYQNLYQREQDEAARIQRDREFAEQQRQFNEQLRASNAGAASLAGLFGGGSSRETPASPQVDPLKQKAQTAVTQLLGTNDRGLIQRTYDAIKKSAGYGNAYDQMKLQLLAAAGFKPTTGQTAQKKSNAPVKTPVNSSLFMGNFALR